MTYLSYIAVFGATICAVFGIAGFFGGSVVATSPAVPSVRRGASFLDRLPRTAGSKVRMGADQRSELALWLIQAGFDSPRAETGYQLLRVVLAVGLPLVLAAILLLVGGVALRTIGSLMAVAALLGLLLPPYVVGRRREGRRVKFREGLPDMLDLLLVCTEAGMGIDSALAKVAEELDRTHPLLGEQLTTISAELRAGRARADAMSGFAARTGIEETMSLVNLLVQSDALGTSMAETLRVFADDMRAHRLLKAEEKAHTVTVKLTLVLAGCFLPAILIAILAPVAFQIIAGFAKLAAPP